MNEDEQLQISEAMERLDQLLAPLFEANPRLDALRTRVKKSMETHQATLDRLKAQEEAAKRPRLFHLQRLEDETGVSGTGRVADGVVFPDGTAVIHWRTEVTSTATYASIEAVRKIHGHGGKTRVIFDEKEK